MVGHRLALRRDPRLDLQQHLQKVYWDHPEVQHVLQQREAKRPGGAAAAAALRLRHDSVAERGDRALPQPERAGGSEQLERGGHPPLGGCVHVHPVSDRGGAEQGGLQGKDGRQHPQDHAAVQQRQHRLEVEGPPEGARHRRHLRGLRVLPQEARGAEVYHVQPRRHDVSDEGRRDRSDGHERIFEGELRGVEAEEDRRDGVGPTGEDPGHGAVPVRVDGSLECGDGCGEMHESDHRVSRDLDDDV